jgi:peptidoglycan lytic transglycosylase
MTRLTSLTALIVLALAGATGAARTSVGETSPTKSLDGPATFGSDSAVAEFQAGRFWHAARMLRTEGAAEGSHADILMLARAEAGWNNWTAVAALLRDAPWLDSEGEGTGFYLLGRAEEEQGEGARAAAAYQAFVLATPGASMRHRAAVIRAARELWRAGSTDEALALLDRPETGPTLRGWLAAELAEDVEDDVESLRALLLRMDGSEAADVAWRMLPDAVLATGDTVAAREMYEGLHDTSSDIRRASIGADLGRLVFASGDTVAARELLVEALESGSRATQARAAAPLMDLDDADAAFTLRLAQILDRAGDGRRALIGYDRVMRASADETSEAPMSMRIERARLMGTVRSRQTEAIEEFRAIREETDDPTLGPRNLERWTQLRSRQGLTSQVSTLRRWLVEEYPGSPQAAELVFSRADQAHTGGRLDSALEQYAFVAENARTHARAGQARMRAGQIHLTRDDLQSAMEVYEAYLQDFPSGRRWQEASYWAGRARLQLGDTVAARAHVDRIASGDPVSYYAVMGAELFGETYGIDVPDVGESEVPGWLSEGLSTLDLFTEAGLERAAASKISELSGQARDNQGDMLSLAEALIERGRTIDGINLGWALRDDGHEWDSRLIRVAFPFPYRELVEREAAEWGIDPIIMASIIRQESAFKADIVSHAGAVGLMQVMPPTGAQLARTHGPRGFRETNLTTAEVNLHLGAAFFVDMSARYDNDLPLVLSAYNAGPTRATRWSRYPEVSDPLRFTERIPFVETRGYVKNVRRNLGLYRALYGPVILGQD